MIKIKTSEYRNRSKIKIGPLMEKKQPVAYVYWKDERKDGKLQCFWKGHFFLADDWHDIVNTVHEIGTRLEYKVICDKKKKEEEL